MDKLAKKADTHTQEGPSKKSETSTCPICQKSTNKAFRPFCSKRCADVDLSRWLNGHYAIPVVEEDGSLPDSTGQNSNGNDFFRE